MTDEQEQNADTVSAGDTAETAKVVEKTIYLIRHGETHGNRALFHQPPDQPLSQVGLSQAHQLIDALDGLPLEAVITSDYFRAKETATIATNGRLSIEATPLFREIVRPSELIGKHFLDPRSVVIMGLIYLRAGDPSWHWSDEENVHDTYARANAALNFLADRPESHIAVFTHRGFIASMLSIIKGAEDTSVKRFLHGGRHSMNIGNASITTLKFRNSPCSPDSVLNTCWQIESVNIQGHLRE